VGRRYLTEAEYATIQRQSDEGIPIGVIARTFGVNRTTVYRIVNSKSAPRQPCGGRQSRFSTRDNTAITRAIKLEHYRPANDIRRTHFPHIPKTTFLWKLRKLGFSFRALRQKPLLSLRQAALRREFCNFYETADQQFWDSVYFVDECSIREVFKHGTRRVLVSSKFAYENTRTSARVRFPKTLMIWAAIKKGSPPIIVPCGGSINGETYPVFVRTGLLRDGHTLPFESVTIFGDNAPAHKSKKVRNPFLLFYCFTML